MRRIIAWAARASFAVMVALALGFGAQQAFGSSAGGGDCQPCATQEECQACCELQGEDGFCTVTHACLCF